MTGYHTRWVRQPEQDEDPERVAIREALAFLTHRYLAGRAANWQDTRGFSVGPGDPPRHGVRIMPRAQPGCRAALVVVGGGS
jgi:hypothetical protein